MSMNLTVAWWNTLNLIWHCWVLIALSTSVTRIPYLLKPYLLNPCHLAISELFLLISDSFYGFFQIFSLFRNANSLIPRISTSTLMLQLLMSFCKFYRVHVQFLPRGNLLVWEHIWIVILKRRNSACASMRNSRVIDWCHRRGQGSKWPLLLGRSRRQSNPIHNSVRCRDLRWHLLRLGWVVLLEIVLQRLSLVCSFLVGFLYGLFSHFPVV